MTVRLLQDMRIAGVTQALGVAVESDRGNEAQWVAEGRALPVPLHQPGLALVGDEAGLVTPSYVVGSGAVLNASGVERIGDDFWLWASITANSASNNWVEMKFPSLLPFIARDMQWEYSFSNLAVGNTIVMYLLDNDSSPVRFATYQHFPGAASTNSPWGYAGRAAAYAREGEWTKNGFSDSLANWQMTAIKLRVFVNNGQTQLFRFRSCRVNPRLPKARLVVHADDGYRRWFRLGQECAREFGIPVTAAIIPSLVGQASYVTWGQIEKSLADGNDVVAHGPEGGAGNLFTRWASDDEAIADMINTRNELQRRGFLRKGGERCYVWPQGVYSRTAGDFSFLDRALLAGFDCARSAWTVARGMCFAALSPKCHQRLVLPVIGHSTAATFDGDTTGDAAETANIDSIIATIQALSPLGQDMHLMLHDSVQRGSATSGLTIETDRLRTLFAAVAAEVEANRLECVRMSDLVA